MGQSAIACREKKLMHILKFLFLDVLIVNVVYALLGFIVELLLNLFFSRELSKCSIEILEGVVAMGIPVNSQTNEQRFDRNTYFTDFRF